MQDSYEAVLRGERSWKEYHEDFIKHMKEEGEDVTYFALEHALSALRKDHESIKHKEFWDVLEKITTYLPPDDTMIGPEYLAKIHKEMLHVARTQKDLLKYPEFWRTVMGTAVVDILPADAVEKTAKSILETARSDWVRKDQQLARTIYTVAGGLREQIEYVKTHKNLKDSERRRLWNAETNLAIASKMLSKLRGRRP